MGIIKAPYNFVPVSKEVVIPHWGKYISHDIPFEDGLSGKIELTITAKTPLFVRDGTKGKDEEQKAHQFSQFQNRHFIPATSIKGMLRNVMEIMTFSKMDKVNDHRYAVRDLSPAAKEVYLNHFKAKDIYCGWLRKNPDETFTLEDCGTPGRISHRDLDDYFGTDFSTYFLKKENGGSFNPKKDREKSARFKYRRFGQKNDTQSFKLDRDDGGRLVYKFDQDGEKGKIVFTGQPGPRFKNIKKDRWEGHHLEFIFFIKDNPRRVEVADQVIQNFYFAYYDHDVNRWSEDYGHWREELNKGRSIPVFFRKDAGGRLADLGLSFLYKLPYNNSVKEAIPQNLSSQDIDLTKAIFGFVDDKDGGENSLKGRVHIGHAFAEKSEVDQEVLAVLSGPKASYYPNYIRQHPKNGKINRYQTFMDKQVKIAGWKRYPVRSETSENAKPANATEKVVSRFVPLKPGAVFSCTIHYHNLKTIELGALLSTISFHDTNGVFHSIGMAKPLGYGKVAFDFELKGDHFKALQAFEAFMCASLATAWHRTDQVQDLLAMSADQNNRGSSKLEYMNLEMRGGNEFRDAKDTRKGGLEFLDRYSRLDGVKVPKINSLVKKEDITEAHEQIERETRLYRSKESLAEHIQVTVREEQAKFQDALDQLKAELKLRLEQQRTQITIKHRAERAERKKEEARNSKPDWDGLDLNHKKVFDDLKKAIMLFVQDYHQDKYYKLTGRMPEGVLPEQYRPELKKKIRTIVQNVSSSDLKHWHKPFKKNAYLKKIAEWIGRSDAEDIGQEL